MNYFVYVKDFVGLQTELDSFHWSLGTAPKTTREEFERCKVRVYLDVVKDGEVFQNDEFNSSGGSFRFFAANSEKGDLYYHRRLFKAVTLNFAIHIENNEIHARVGRSYLKRVKVKLMNIHPIGYILFDFTTTLLLREGYTMLYCSAFEKNGEGAVIMAPPNSGKTLTAVKLCRDANVRVICEDIGVTDGSLIYSVPYTDTYRDYGAELNSVAKNQEPGVTATLKSLFILEKGESSRAESDPGALRKISLLNRYGIGYYRSPAVIAFCYFNPSFELDAMCRREADILKTMADKCGVTRLTAVSPFDFSELIAERIN